MLWTIAVIVFILWLLGAFVMPVGGSLIHILLVIAIIVVLYRIITGRKPIP
ncbi:MAG: lmo0937 family membrane protein [Gemmatimonadaceae bacterium]